LYFLLLKSYLKDRTFQVRQGNENSISFDIYAGVLQGSLLFPDLYNIFTFDIPTDPNTILATYADDTAILSINKNPISTSDNLQKHTSKIETWSKKWKTKIN
jgi:hypothetical protein